VEAKAERIGKMMHLFTPTDAKINFQNRTNLIKIELI
jgi:FtsZ-interacting cell division protein YlmF